MGAARLAPRAIVLRAVDRDAELRQRVAGEHHRQQQVARSLEIL